MTSPARAVPLPEPAAVANPPLALQHWATDRIRQSPRLYDKAVMLFVAARGYLQLARFERYQTHAPWPVIEGHVLLARQFNRAAVVMRRVARHYDTMRIEERRPAPTCLEVWCRLVMRRIELEAALADATRPLPEWPASPVARRDVQIAIGAGAPTSALFFALTAAGRACVAEYDARQQRGDG